MTAREWLESMNAQQVFQATMFNTMLYTGWTCLGRGLILIEGPFGVEHLYMQMPLESVQAAFDALRKLIDEIPTVKKLKEEEK